VVTDLGENFDTQHSTHKTRIALKDRLPGDMLRGKQPTVMTCH
jgi:hypothetical protein